MTSGRIADDLDTHACHWHKHARSPLAFIAGLFPRICVSRLHMPDINLFEQDHRTIKLCLGPMLGLKRFRCTSITIAGIELMHRIKKGPFNLG